MFERLGRAVYRRRKVVLWASLVGVLIAAVWGFGVFRSLQVGGFDDPNSESIRAEERAAAALGRDEADLVIVYSSGDRTVDDPRFRSAVESTLAALPDREVTSQATFWSTGADRFVSADRHSTYAVLQVEGGNEEDRLDSYEEIKDSLDAPGLRTEVGGAVASQAATSEQILSDLGRAEGIAMPLVLILLVVVFGGIVAASLPLIIGIVGILGAFASLRLLTLVTDVSVFAPNVVTVLGLGLAVDYGLFMVSRFREELRRTSSTEDALARTMATAGRTVAVSGVIVAVSLASLMLFPQFFLRTMGFGGVAAVAVDMIAALTILPALLAVLGPKVNKWSVRRPRVPAAERSGGFWDRLATNVMRRPVAYVVVIVAALLALGTPFLRIDWGGVDPRVLPNGTPEREAFETFNEQFPGNADRPIQAVVTLPGSAGGSALPDYVERLESVPGVTGSRVTTEGEVSRVDLTYDARPMSGQARDIVEQVRDVAPPGGGEVLVGGDSAELVDQLDGMGRTLPWMALTAGLAMFVLLFFAFGSLLLPIKAILMNALSLTATFGALVWIFQDGNLSGVLGFTPTGWIEPSMPILLLAIVFGLSMDYEVFLLSRIREQYDLTGDNTRAVATGLQRTGGIITSAALLLLIVIGAFATSGVTFIKLIGVGMAIAVVVDATVVRALLVPATMRLLGRANWWAPGPLRRLYSRYGIREGERPAEEEELVGARG